MKILIVGAGIVGSNLAEELSQEGHEVSIIDRNPDKIKELSDTLDVFTMVGNAARPSVLKTAGIKESEMVVAVTEIDEVNIIVCMLAHELGVKMRVARIRNEEYTNKEAVLNLHEAFISRVINPEQIVVDSITKIIETPGATYVAQFADGEILLRGFDIPPDAPVVGKKLAELKEISQAEGFLITGIYRDNRLIIPRGTDEIKIGDHIFVLLAKDTLPLFLPLINKRVWDVQRVIIYGAGFTSLNLATRLEKEIKEVIILEESEEKAEAAAAKLSKTIVLRGKGTDLDLLKEANINHTDFFIALSGDDESNLTSSLLAKKHGAKKVIVITNDPDYVPILDSIDTDVVINPRLITVGAILEYIRRGKVRSVRSVVKLKESEAEVIELVAVSSSRIVGTPLKEIKFPTGAIVGMILRGNTPIIPTGDTVIKPSEKVIIFALPESIKKIEKLFEAR